MSDNPLRERVEARIRSYESYLQTELRDAYRAKAGEALAVDLLAILASPEPSREESRLCPMTHGAEHDMELVWYCETCGHREPAKARDPSREGVGREIYGKYGSVIGHTNCPEPSRDVDPTAEELEGMTETTLHGPIPGLGDAPAREELRADTPDALWCMTCGYRRGTSSGQTRVKCPHNHGELVRARLLTLEEFAKLTQVALLPASDAGLREALKIVRSTLQAVMRGQTVIATVAISGAIDVIDAALTRHEGGTS